MDYRPEPIDTAQVALGSDILELTELLARNTHEVWARARMAQGWVWGEKRNDDLLTHPDLRPYEDLSEIEKDYDRSTALETLRTIAALGYQITRPSSPLADAPRRGLDFNADFDDAQESHGELSQGQPREVTP